MKLRFLTETEAKEIALNLRGSITKKKLDAGIKKLKKMPNSFGAPYDMFFTPVGEDIFRAQVLALLASPKKATWHERRAFEFLLRDVLAGLDALIRNYKESRKEVAA